MRRLAFALVFAVAGYVLAALLGYVGVQHLSSNVHDRDVEAAMTAAFFFGPVGAVAGLVTGLVRGRRPADR